MFNAPTSLPMLLYLSYPKSGRCALKSPAIIVLVFASFMSGRPEFVPGGQYILWVVKFVLDFVQIVVFLPINIIVGEIFCFSSNVISNKCHDALTVGAKVFFFLQVRGSLVYPGMVISVFLVGLFLARVQYVLLCLAVILLVLFSCFVVH